MKLFTPVVLAFAALATVNATPMVRQEADAGNCNLTGTYKSGTDVSTCKVITIGPLTVPGNVTLDLTNVQAGATIEFTGTTTFGEAEGPGPLVKLTGTDLTVKGSGTLDGQGSWYWNNYKTNSKFTRPVFFRMENVIGSTVSDFTILNSPYRTFSILNSQKTVVNNLTLDSSAGDVIAKNTDGFDLSGNTGVNITNNKVHNQDDCLAMQSSTTTLFAGNTCTGGHGISIGSIGGPSASPSDTVNGLTVSNNKVINSVNGIRIKTITGDFGAVENIKYIGNTLTNVQNAIVIRGDYSKAQQGYTGSATSLVTIKGITISGLSGTATTLYQILVNNADVSDWSFSGITVTTSSKGSCSGQPSGIC